MIETRSRCSSRATRAATSAAPGADAAALTVAVRRDRSAQPLGRRADLPARHGGAAALRGPVYSIRTSAMSSSSRPCTHSTSARLQRGQAVADRAVAEQPPGPLGGREELAVPARLGQPVGEQQQPVAGLQPLDPGPDHRHEAQRRRRRRRVQRDHLAPAQQQRRRMPAVDDGQRAAALLDQGRGDEVLVADAAGHRPVQVGDDRRAGRPARRRRAGTSRARCWPAGPRRGPCRARRR